MSSWKPGATPAQDPKTGAWSYIAEPQPGTYSNTDPLACPITFNGNLVPPQANPSKVSSIIRNAG